MALYNTAAVAAALGVTPKWLDNLLSHNTIDGLKSESQGVARRLSVTTITVLVLAKELVDTLDLTPPVAIRFAERLLNEPCGELIISARLRITLQVDTLKADVLARLARAVEIAPTPRRGRPPKR